jgi:hypothetical protein
MTATATSAQNVTAPSAPARHRHLRIVGAHEPHSRRPFPSFTVTLFVVASLIVGALVVQEARIRSRDAQIATQQVQQQQLVQTNADLRTAMAQTEAEYREYRTAGIQLALQRQAVQAQLDALLAGAHRAGGTG